MKSIEPVKVSPQAFEDAFSKLNSCIKQVNALSNVQGRGGIKVWVGDSNFIIEYNPDFVGTGGIPGSGSSSSGLPAGYTFTQFTICNSGNSNTVWWPIWPNNPT